MLAQPHLQLLAAAMWDGSGLGDGVMPTKQHVTATRPERSALCGRCSPSLRVGASATHAKLEHMRPPTVIPAVAIAMIVCACKQPAAAPAAAPPAHAEQLVSPPPDSPAEQGRPVRDEFELDEDTDDPAAALDSMRHNCCDEMPAEEIRDHVGGKGPTPTKAKSKRP
jgi:hypothetical protein